MAEDDESLHLNGTTKKFLKEFNEFKTQVLVDRETARQERIQTQRQMEDIKSLIKITVSTFTAFIVAVLGILGAVGLN